MRIPEDLLDKITDQVSEALEQSKQTRQDLTKNVRSLIQSQLSKLDVVSREEFDSQQRVLVKTRTQIEQLEQQLATLEEKLNSLSE